MAQGWDDVDDFLYTDTSKRGDGGGNRGVPIGPPVRKGVYPGLVVNRVVVLDGVKKGRRGPGSKLHECRCLVCKRVFWAGYSKLFYFTIRNCGCRKWTRKPGGKAYENEMFGEVRVMGWVEDLDGGWECVCERCGSLMMLRNVQEIRRAAKLA